MNFDMCNKSDSVTNWGETLMYFLSNKTKLEPAFFFFSSTGSNFKMAGTPSSANDEVDDLFSRFMTEVRRNVAQITSFLMFFFRWK